MATKQNVLADESLFQRACSQFVGSNVHWCMSSLFYDIGRDLEASSKLFDIDYEELASYFSVTDYVEPVLDYINEADLDDLETIADMVGYWSDVVGKYPTAIELEDEEGDTFWQVEGGERHDDEDEANRAVLEANIEEIRKAVKDLITEDGEYREIADDFDIEPEEDEVYEHWLVDRYFGARLEERGELVFEFCNMTVWGRCTTGQSISLDGVIRSMVRDLDEDHWLWRAL